MPSQATNVRCSYSQVLLKFMLYRNIERFGVGCLDNVVDTAEKGERVVSRCVGQRKSGIGYRPQWNVVVPSKAGVCVHICIGELVGF